MAADGLDEFKKELQDLCRNYWSSASGGSARELFHYCNATGLYGIVTDRVLWASDIFSLNDASEVDYAMRVVCDALVHYGPMGPIAERFRDGTLLQLYKTWQTHVCCFSSDEDSLSQWRAYGAGGYGFAIGFDLALLTKSATSDGCMVVPILYSEEQQQAKVNEFISSASRLLEASTFEPRNELFVEIAHALVALMAPIKNPKFNDEREWRILRIKAANEQRDTFFRATHGAIVSYNKLSVPTNCFTRIVQGPTLHQEFGERSLKIFLRNNGLEHVKVESSVIPLRSL